MKNNCCLFQRIKNQNAGVFLFGISFFVLEILMFFYYANYESDDVIRFATKIVKYWVKNIFWKYWSSIFQTCHQKWFEISYLSLTSKYLYRAYKRINFCSMLIFSLCFTDTLEWRQTVKGKLSFLLTVYTESIN